MKKKLIVALIRKVRKHINVDVVFTVVCNFPDICVCAFRHRCAAFYCAHFDWVANVYSNIHNTTKGMPSRRNMLFT